MLKGRLMDDNGQYPSDDTMETNAGSFHSGLADAARREVDDLRHRATDFAAQVRDQGRSAKTTALGLIVDELDIRKAALVDGLTAISYAVRDLSGQQGMPSALMGQAVRLLDTAAETLDGHPVQDVGAMLTDLSRRSPALFVAGCLLTGVAVGRFITATAPASRIDGTDDQPRPDAKPDAVDWQSHQASAPLFDGPGYPTARTAEGGQDGTR